VTWIPGKDNISDDISKYSSSLEVYATSMAATYGQAKVSFLYARPAESLVEGITVPNIQSAQSVEFDQWPKSLESIAAELGRLARKKTE